MNTILTAVPVLAKPITRGDVDYVLPIAKCGEARESTEAGNNASESRALENPDSRGGSQALTLASEIGKFIETHGKQLTRKERFMLGLGRAALLMQPGECRTRQDIATDAGVSRQAIEHIENRALRKCRSTSLRLLAKEHLEWKPQQA